MQGKPDVVRQQCACWPCVHRADGEGYMDDEEGEEAQEEGGAAAGPEGGGGDAADEGAVADGPTAGDDALARDEQQAARDAR